MDIKEWKEKRISSSDLSKLIEEELQELKIEIEVKSPPGWGIVVESTPSDDQIILSSPEFCGAYSGLYVLEILCLFKKMSEDLFWRFINPAKIAEIQRKERLHWLDEELKFHILRLKKSRYDAWKEIDEIGRSIHPHLIQFYDPFTDQNRVYDAQSLLKEMRNMEFPDRFWERINHCLVEFPRIQKH